jgi:hypothetical protein
MSDPGQTKPVWRIYVGHHPFCPSVVPVTESVELPPDQGEPHDLIFDRQFVLADRATALCQVPHAHGPDEYSPAVRSFRKANLRMFEMRLHRNQNCFRSPPLRTGRPPDNQYLATGMTEDLTLLQIIMRVGMSCALTAVGAVGIFMIIRFVAWVG